jgi:hypothetical protein
LLDLYNSDCTTNMASDWNIYHVLSFMKHSSKIES